MNAAPLPDFAAPRRAPPPRSSRRSRSSTSTRSTPTRPTCCAWRRASRVRLASKSVRCRALVDARAWRRASAACSPSRCPRRCGSTSTGSRTSSSRYPTTDAAALAAAAGRPDDADGRLRGPSRRRAARRRACASTSTRAGGRSAAGSASARAARRCARPRRPRRWRGPRCARGLVVDGLMAYEAQIAGVGDRPPGRPLLRRRGAGHAGRLGARAGRAGAPRSSPRCAAVAPLRFVNGGGTGSVARTAADPAVTEVAAGSGLFGPTLFDAYRAWRPRPAAFFVLPVVRKPSAATATVLGGGYVASGAPGRDRLPRPVHPPGLRLDRAEGAGEVQTPLLGPRRRGARAWATGCGSGTPRRASCASASTRWRSWPADELVGRGADLPGRGPRVPVTARQAAARAARSPERARPSGS